MCPTWHCVRLAGPPDRLVTPAGPGVIPTPRGGLVRAKQMTWSSADRYGLGPLEYLGVASMGC